MDSNKAIDLNQLLFDPQFKLESLMLKSRDANLNLPQLKDCLLSYQQDLNQNSLDLFNNNYDRFYKLSYFISCITDPIEHLNVPLSQFKQKLEELCQNHDNYLIKIDERLQAIDDLNRNKELARILIQHIKRHDRLEARMRQVEWPAKATKKLQQFDQVKLIEYKIKCDLIERLSVEYYHLNSQINTIKPTRDELRLIKESLQSNIRGRQLELDNWFERTFLNAIELQDKQLIDLILPAYRQRDSVKSLLSVWRERVVQPYLDLTLTESQLLSKAGQTYELLIQFLDNQIALMSDSSFIKCFWDQVVATLKKLVKIYLLDELGAFHKRYSETKTFLKQQNKYLGDKSVPFSASDIENNCASVISRFNLSGFFNIRLAQMATSIETGLVQQPLSEIANGDNGDAAQQFKLKICLQLYLLIENCWSPDLFIEELECQYIQLTCRLINRFADWLSKLRLSDFRITGSPAPNASRQTNFLARQDAIMRLLLDDCCRLQERITDFLALKRSVVGNLKALMLEESFVTLTNGLSNVRSLQRLIER